MGEHQCEVCGHITTGFENQDFALMREAEVAKDAEIERLRGALEEIASGLSVVSGYDIANTTLKPLT
jgi:hypothetical protein